MPRGRRRDAKHDCGLWPRPAARPEGVASAAGPRSHGQGALRICYPAAMTSGIPLWFIALQLALTAAVAIGGAFIALGQLHTARKKLALDLFNQRRAVVDG